MIERVSRTRAGFAALLALGLTFPAAAATQGSLGASSRGSIAISVSLRAPVRADGLSDFALDGGTPARNVCFRGAPHGYAIAASGSGPEGALTLSNGDDSISYRVEWLAHSDGNLTPAIAAEELPAGVAGCSDAKGPGRLALAFEPTDVQRLRTGRAYTGSLVVLLAPE